MPGHYKTKRPKRTTRARIAFETRAKNLDFYHSIKRAQDRGNLRMERDRLTGLLHTNINPGLRERMAAVREDISGILGD